MEISIASEETSALAHLHPATLPSCDFADLEAAVDFMRKFAVDHPVEAVVAVDDQATLAAAVDRGRFPHATLIHGAQGSGRRHLVTSLAARLLHLTGAGDPAAATEGDLLRHPDFLGVNPEPDKQSISVDQIR